MHSFTFRNVNHALPVAVMLFNTPSEYRVIAPRGEVTREILEPVVTTYLCPTERVLFSPERDANPFFHFFEALWILSGRDDVGYLEYFLPRIKVYSDNGSSFHGAYGKRMRYPKDQVKEVVYELLCDANSRRAVVSLWQPNLDSGYVGRDMPCNISITFKIRDDVLNMTVFNRSNDMVWGAYGANVVQFSVVQEYVAAMLKIKVGVYHQISDSFHIYENQDAWKNVSKMGLIPQDPYENLEVTPYQMVEIPHRFEEDLSMFIELMKISPNKDIKMFSWNRNSFFPDVAVPLFNSFRAYKDKDIDRAIGVAEECKASDWRLASINWLARRKGMHNVD